MTSLEEMENRIHYLEGLIDYLYDMVPCLDDVIYQYDATREVE